MMALECEFKSLSDDLEEDEDLHNKLKSSDQIIISDEQITVDKAKISTLVTSIPDENAKVSCVITEEIDTLEKDLLAKPEISKFPDMTANRDANLLAKPEISKFPDMTANRGAKQLAEYRDANRAMY